MAKYRIVKRTGYDRVFYKVQRRVWRVWGLLGYYWRDDTGMFFSLKHCEDYIQKQLKPQEKYTVVREY